MGHNINRFLTIILIFIVGLSGCQTVDDVRVRQQQASQYYQAQQAGESEVSQVPKLDARIQCGNINLDDCGLLVTLNAVDEDIVLDVRSHVDDGISFLPNLDVLPDQGGREGMLARVRLMAGESRDVFFPYRPSNPNLPGSYRTGVVASKSETYELYDYKEFDAYIYLDEFGEYHLLPTGTEYNEHYHNSFTPGDIGLSYRVDLVGGERPHRGNVVVRVDSPEDDFAPLVQVESTGAISFLPDGTWRTQVQQQGQKTYRQFPLMNEGGTRVVKFPFEMDKNGRLLDGTYAFVVTLLTENGKKAKSEKMPILIQVQSNPQDIREKWLSFTTRDMSIVTPTPNSQLPTINSVARKNEVGYGGRPWLDPNEAQRQCDKLADVQFPQNYSKPSWTFEIANYNGTLCQAYLKFAAGQVGITWRDFKDQAIYYNQNLNSEKDQLYDHQVYVMPESG